MEPVLARSMIPRISGSHSLEDFVFMLATGDIDKKVARLANHSLVAWESELLVGIEKMDSTRFTDDFTRFFNVHLMDIQVKKFHLEDFLVTLANPTNRDAAIEVGHISVNGRVYAFRAWDIKLHANPASLLFHVRLCIEGLPMHASKNIRGEQTTLTLLTCGSGASTLTPSRRLCGLSFQTQLLPRPQ
ncbi:hypothetical protein ABZP36_021653 [Zizania latifolia]